MCQKQMRICLKAFAFFHKREAKYPAKQLGVEQGNGSIGSSVGHKTKITKQYHSNLRNYIIYLGLLK